VSNGFSPFKRMAARNDDEKIMLKKGENIHLN
jgi:hypothetical protein